MDFRATRAWAQTPTQREGEWLVKQRLHRETARNKTGNEGAEFGTWITTSSCRRAEINIEQQLKEGTSAFQRDVMEPLGLCQNPEGKLSPAPQCTQLSIPIKKTCPRTYKGKCWHVSISTSSCWKRADFKGWQWNYSKTQIQTTPLKNLAGALGLGFLLCPFETFAFKRHLFNSVETVQILLQERWHQ